MKVGVFRELVEGRYQVAFKVTDFTPEEVKKMSQFGTPTIVMKRQQANALVNYRVQITQVPQIAAAFSDEDSAKQYELGVLQQLREAIEGVRAREDKFTSSEEIAF